MNPEHRLAAAIEPHKKTGRAAALGIFKNGILELQDTRSPV